METLDAIMTRRAVRSWSAQRIPEETLERVLEAGRMAPSPLNSQPWHFTVVRSPATIEELMRHAHHGTFLSRANAVIVVTVQEEAKVDAWLAEHAQHIYSGVCAIQNMWLAAWDLGLGACWVTLDEAATRVALGIPAGHRLLGSLALGYPDAASKLQARKSRNSLSVMVSYERFETV